MKRNFLCTYFTHVHTYSLYQFIALSSKVKENKYVDSTLLKFLKIIYDKVHLHFAKVKNWFWYMVSYSMLGASKRKIKLVSKKASSRNNYKLLKWRAVLVWYPLKLLNNVSPALSNKARRLHTTVEIIELSTEIQFTSYIYFPLILKILLRKILHCIVYTYYI